MTPATLTPPAPVDDGTRRELLAAGVALSLGLAGCGGEDQGGGSGPPADGFPVTVRHRFGNTTFRSAPERVVTLDAAGMLDPVLALGVRPVGGVQLDGGRFPTVLEGRTAGIEPVGVNVEPNVESIAALAPDFIVGYEFSFAEARRQITAIAPTIAFPDTVTWREVLDTLARVLDRRPQRDRWVRRVEAGVRDARRVADGLSVAVITDATDGTFFVSGPRYDSSALLVQAGMDVRTLSDPVEDPGNGAVVVSDERLGELDADHLVVVTYEPEPAKRVNAFAKHPLWPRLRAVRAGNVHVIDGSTWNNFGPIALVAMLREAADLFARR